MPEWLKALLGIGATGTRTQAPTGAATPPYQGSQGAGAPQQGNERPWWADLLGAGAGIAATVAQGRAQGQQNNQLQQQAQFNQDLAKQELAKRQFFSEILLPQLMHGMRRTPQNAQSAMQQFQGMRPQGYVAPQQMTQNPAQPTSQSPNWPNPMDPNDPDAWWRT